MPLDLTSAKKKRPILQPKIMTLNTAAVDAKTRRTTYYVSCQPNTLAEGSESAWTVPEPATPPKKVARQTDAGTDSQGHLFIINGSPKDKYGGVSAIISPSTRPFVKDVFQHSSRILHIVTASQSGDTHFIGVYAPHDKLDFETVKDPFWLLLQSVLDKIAQPEPVYVLGDFYVRLQGRKKSEQKVLGPHVYSRGAPYAKTGPERNRDLYINLLQSTDSCDVMSFKCDNLIEQVSYRNRTLPPIDWGLFALDSIRLFQFWDKIASLPLSEPETLSIGHNIRTFLTDEPLMNTTLIKPQVDPFRFQALDRIIRRYNNLFSDMTHHFLHDCWRRPRAILPISSVQPDNR